MSESNVRHAGGRPTSRRTHIEDLAATGPPLSDEALRGITGGAALAAGPAAPAAGPRIVGICGVTTYDNGATYDDCNGTCTDDR